MTAAAFPTEQRRRSFLVAPGGAAWRWLWPGGGKRGGGPDLASARSGGIEARLRSDGVRRRWRLTSAGPRLCQIRRHGGGCGAAAVAVDVMEVVGRTACRRAAGPRLHQIRRLRPGGGGRGGGPNLASARSGGMEACHAQKFPNRIPSRMCIKILVQDRPGYTNDNIDIQIHREHHSTGILNGTDEAYSSEKPSSDTYPCSGHGGGGAALTCGTHRSAAREREEGAPARGTHRSATQGGGRFTMDRDHAGGPPPVHGIDGPDRPRGRSDGRRRPGSAQGRPSGHGDCDGARANALPATATGGGGDGAKATRRRQR
ncbi:hypothetical protein [Oryza sativa Japonica Group]|uniref:Uncharacterized protein n=1 Tax=Oryza sativa subsp. japonica TaxID=39947 RepID=Q5JL49_ORYSJ|nr:hypothetical protein [Oryza sativa Japonica Group]